MKPLYQKGSFNNDHPEMLAGEAFLGNWDTEHESEGEVLRRLRNEHFTARLGKVAYSRSGEVISKAVPVFYRPEDEARLNQQKPAQTR